ncbi:MAG: sigma-54 dependent transcriptional regulator [Holosporaceae bacterium]|jgi:transcriptional regulator with PAS, ATPase and Fis domain|nr:sigma-54 dependent transcriptional regulator [Holosporaceae bacterium]
MKIIVVGEKLEDLLFEIVRVATMLNWETIFCKQSINGKISVDDIVVIDSALIHLLSSRLENTVITLATIPNYVASLRNETIIYSIKSLEKVIRSKTHFVPIVEDPATRQAFQIADKIAPTDATVLITGETGTGKEVLARHIHRRSVRSSRNFIAINCAAIPETLLESELFGHERGAFTNAVQRRIGKFEEANGGTILLDEISEMSLGLQAKMLRVLQEKEISRLGSNDIIKLDVRIIATSNRDLLKIVQNGGFKQDLFYRLNVISIEMPRLNDRPLDIIPLSNFFCEKYSEGRKSLSTRFLSLLKRHLWQGNIRELENVIHRSVLLSSKNVIDDFLPYENYPAKTRQLYCQNG